MPETIQPSEERELVEAAKQAAAYVETGGLHPNAAVEKVARDYGFGAGKITLLGHAYNTGAQLTQWRQPNTNVLTKLATFDLCDPTKVIEKIYGPATEKTASISSDYSKPPSWLEPVTREKTAYTLPVAFPAPYYTPPDVEAAYSAVQRAQIAADDAMRKAAAAEDQLRVKIASLVTYFNEAPVYGFASDRFGGVTGGNKYDPATAEKIATVYFGQDVEKLFDVLHPRFNLKQARADKKPLLLKTAADISAYPFTGIKDAIDAARSCGQLRQQATELRQKVAKVREVQLRALFPSDQQRVKQAFGFGTEVAAIAAGDILAHKATHNESEEDPYGDVASLDTALAAIREQAERAKKLSPAILTKRAFLGPGIGAAIGGSLGRTVGPLGKPKSELVNDTWMKLEDPEHDNELKKIRAQAMINQLMTDPDEPISAHDPDRILSAFNEIQSATPRLAENIATLRPALRKRLEGHQEPFEAKELLDIEHGLARTKAPQRTSIMGEQSDIFG